ncbi:hypothetical protein PAPYR_6985 [Paratrimastix pyriformis]|uniref:Carbonic anhydrase n=1 Tax=Paratrimastix pyriformis TaxID=342808 RepID=A0ABQ8UFG6_9EUKA|nr:hypothetical protein PAPYR_6985 [Paratrimastix pyriformis]
MFHPSSSSPLGQPRYSNPAGRFSIPSPALRRSVSPEHLGGHVSGAIATALTIESVNLESPFWYFIEANRNEKTVQYLANKTELLSKREVRTLVLDCSDSRSVVARAPDSIVYATAATAISPRVMETIVRNFRIQTVLVAGHESCGGCALRATLDGLPKGAHPPHGVTDALVELGCSLPSSNPNTNALAFGRSFQEMLGPQGLVQSLYYRITDGAVLQAEAAAPAQGAPKRAGGHYFQLPPAGYSPIDPNGWDMRLGQDPRYVVFCLGCEYSPMELVQGSAALNRPNVIFEVVSPVFDTNLLATLHYCWGHALSATTNTAGCSFNHTATFIMCVSAEREQEGREVLAKLTADPVLVQYTQPHPAVGGTRGEVYFCVHQGGRIVKAQRVAVEIR